MSDAVKVGFVPLSAAARGVLAIFCDDRLELGGATRKALGAAVAFIFGKEPEQQVREDLRAYKAFVETGEVPTICGQSSARKRQSTCREGE